MRQHHHDLAAGDFRQPQCLHLGRRLQQQCRSDQGSLGERFHDDAATQLFHHHHRIDRAQTQAVMRFGNGQAGQAQAHQAIPGLA